MATVSAVQIDIGATGNWLSGSLEESIELNSSRFYRTRVLYSDGTTSTNVSCTITAGHNFVTTTDYGSAIYAINTYDQDGTSIVTFQSTEDPSVFTSLTVIVGTGGEELSVLMFFLSEKDSDAQLDDTVTLNAGETITVKAEVLMSDYSITPPPAPVSWELAGGETLISIESTTYNTVTVRAGNISGTSGYVYASCTYAGSTTTARFRVKVEGTAPTPTVTSMQILYNGTWYSGNLTITLQVGDSTALQARAVMSDGTYQYGIAWGSPTPSGIVSMTLSNSIATIKALTAGNAVMICRSTINAAVYRTISFVVEEIPIVDDTGGYAAFIYDATTQTWDEYIPYIYDATTGLWTEYMPYIYPDFEESAEPTYTVETASGASYGFALNSSTGYYVSQNASNSNSAAVAKITITAASAGYKLYIDCLSEGEMGYDYGIISMIGKTLLTTKDDDGDTGVSPVMYNFKDDSSSELRTIEYGELSAGTHVIYAKYRKDGSVNEEPDTFSFKVRFSK